MDADYDPATAPKKSKKKKKKNKLAEALETKKPIFNPGKYKSQVRSASLFFRETKTTFHAISLHGRQFA